MQMDVALIVIFHVFLIIPILMGIPLGTGLIICGLSLIVYIAGSFGMSDTLIIAQQVMVGTDSPSMMALPFFILAGELMNRGGLTMRIVDFANVFVGRIKGGIGYVAILACLLFASLVGSAVASTAALAAVLVPMMVRSGYDRQRSAALISGANMMAPIMPPSIPLIVFGISAGVSINKLFMAGIAPAIYIAISTGIVWFFVSRKLNVEKNHEMPPFTIKVAGKAFARGIWALLMPVIIIVGMRGGVFTPTEAGVVAVAYAMLIGFAVTRELKFKDMFASLISAAKMSSVIMFLAASATVAAYAMTIGNIPAMITNSMHGLTESPMMLMFAVTILVLIVGLAMDVIPSILILTPILMPLIKQAGIDPVYFGIIFVLVNVLGLLTPPVGPVLNVACSASRISLESILKPVMPYLLIQVVLVFIMIMFPQTILAPMRWILGTP